MNIHIFTHRQRSATVYLASFSPTKADKTVSRQFQLWVICNNNNSCFLLDVVKINSSFNYHGCAMTDILG